jgi:5'-nucleotidase/UDP-sugar diphosphatase
VITIKIRLTTVLIITALLFTLISCGPAADNSGDLNSDLNSNVATTRSSAVSTTETSPIPNYSLTVFSTNDIHGNLDALPKFSTIVNKARAEKSNVLLVDAGDFFRKGPYENFQGKIEIDIFNKMGYDAVAAGNNEYDVPPDIPGSYYTNSKNQISNIIRWANFPVLNSNISLHETNKPDEGLEPYTVKSIGGLKIGIIALACKDNSDDIRTYRSSDLALAEILPEVKKVSDIQIVLGHDNMSVLRNMKGIGAILSGHEHTATPYPFLTFEGRPIMQAGGEAQYLAQLDLEFEFLNGTWELIRYSGKLHSASNIEADQSVRAIVEEYKKQPIPYK